jgi:hypothetical protein
MGAAGFELGDLSRAGKGKALDKSRKELGKEQDNRRSG